MIEVENEFVGYVYAMYLRYFLLFFPFKASNIGMEQLGNKSASHMYAMHPIHCSSSPRSTVEQETAA